MKPKTKESSQVDSASGRKKLAGSPDYALLKKMWEAGESYHAMAKATDAGYDANKPDPTKLTRYRIWRGRHYGFLINGKLVKFGEPRR